MPGDASNPSITKEMDRVVDSDQGPNAHSLEENRVVEKARSKQQGPIEQTGTTPTLKLAQTSSLAHDGHGGHDFPFIAMAHETSAG